MKHSIIGGQAEVGQSHGSTEGELSDLMASLAAYLPSKLLPALTGFITAPILTRLFLPAQYGDYALAMGLVDFLYAVACSGFGSAAVRFFPVYRAKGSLGVFFSSLLSDLVLVIVTVSVVGISCLYLLRDVLPDSLLLMSGIALAVFAGDAVFGELLQILRVREKQGLFTLFELTGRYVGLVFGLLLVIRFGLGIEGLLWGMLMGFGLPLPFLAVATLRGNMPRLNLLRRADMADLWKYAWPLGLGNLAMWGLRLSDRYVIGVFRPGDEVGLYSVAYDISGKSIDVLVALFLLSQGPIIMNLWEAKGRESTEKATAMIARVYIILCLPAAAGLSALALPFVSLLTAEPYHEGYRVVAFVAFSSAIWGLSQLAGYGILLRNQTRAIATNQALAAAVNLGLNLVLVPRFGFVAAGFTTLLGYAVLLALQSRSSRPYLSWQFPFRALRNSTIASALMCLAIICVYAIPGMSSQNPFLLFGSIVIAVPVYFGCLLALGELNAEERLMFSQLWRRVTGTI